MTDNWQIFTSADGSRSFFARVRGCVRAMVEYRIIIDEGADAIQGGGGCGHSENDPTASRAIFLAENDDKVRADAKRKLEECEDVVGVGLAVTSTVRDRLGERYGDCLEYRYIDCLSIHQTAEEMNCSTSTVKRDTDIAHDWIDSQTIEGLFS